MGTAGFSHVNPFENQGVTTEEATRAHLAFVATTLSVNPNMRIDRYRVNPNYPNGTPNNG